MGDSSTERGVPTEDPDYPAWLDRDRYPFNTSLLDLAEGRLHVVDDGEGRPVVMVHGNPTWSFLYRHLVRGLSDEYRCVAPDLFGFGLSARPSGFSYRPAAHARVVGRLVDALDLRDAVLVGHDWGGPIALDVATRRPDAVAGVAVTNTWMWPRRDLPAQLLGRLAAAPPVKRLVLRHDAFTRAALGYPHRVHSAFDSATYRHYRAPLATAEDRVGSWTLLRELTRAGEWLDDLWSRREAVAGLPALFLWGRRDPVHAPFLARWRSVFPDASETVYDDVGHFVPEEAGTALVSPVREFLERL